jgi:hypothetical protein
MILAVAWRLVSDWEDHPVPRGIAAAVTAVFLLALGSWAYAGPMQKGWARKAGTPDSLLGGTDAAAATIDAPDTFAPPFAAATSGTVTQSGTTTAETVTLDGTITGEATGHLTIAIQGTAVDGGGVRMQSGTLSMGPDDQPSLWSGPISRLSGDLVIAEVTGPGGAVAHASVQISVASDRASYSGTVTTTGGA